jgi:hypothetical protein
MKTKLKNLSITLCALAVGIVNGLFGGGGGMICVPALSRVLNKETKVAHATTLFVMFPISIASMIVYLTAGEGFDFLSNIWIISGVLIGGAVGALLLKKIKGNVISIIFAIIMLVAGIRMLF